MASTAPSPAPAHDRRAWRWLDDRLGIGGLRYPVPEHANSLAYTLGGITLASFVLLVITGIYLAQFYDPTPERAHASVVYITDTAGVRTAGDSIERQGIDTARRRWQQADVGLLVVDATVGWTATHDELLAERSAQPTLVVVRHTTWVK